MIKEEQKIIMPEDAAELKTVTGWVTADGRFFGKEERLARYHGCTHKVCECGKLMEKAWTLCESCRARKSRERYNAMPFKEWDGETPVVISGDDHYFFNEDDIEEYCDDQEIQPEDLQLIICEPNRLFEINEGHWEDVLPEDDYSFPKEVTIALEALNKAIRESKPVSWSPGKYRTTYTK